MPHHTDLVLECGCCMFGFGFVLHHMAYSVIKTTLSIDYHGRIYDMLEENF